MATIFITDDSDFTGDLLTDLLEEVGYQVFYAVSGEELLERFDEVRPDVVLLDIIMPGIGGMEVLERIRTTYPDTKVIICSALVCQPSIEEEAMGKGAYACVKKPINTSELREVIAESLKG